MSEKRIRADLAALRREYGDRGLDLPDLLPDPVEMFRSWGRDLTWMLRELDHGLLTVTCHPEVIGRGHRLLALEEWLDAVAGEDVEFVTAKDAVDRYVGGLELGVPAR